MATKRTVNKNTSVIGVKRDSIEKRDTIRRSSHAEPHYPAGDVSVYVWRGCGDDCCGYGEAGEDRGAVDAADSPALQEIDRAEFE